MEIVVNHMTRMRGGHVCVAGLDGEGRHVRPVLEGERLRKELASDYGGPFQLGAVVDLGGTRPRPAPPEIEDAVFDPAATRVIRVVEPAEFWGALEDGSATSLHEIFGRTLARDGRTASLAPGTGIASLGIYRPEAAITIDYAYEKLRIEFIDPDLGRLSVPVTDLRLYDLERDVVRDRELELIQDRLRRCNVLLSVGVGRPWGREGEDPRHWLQVNNLHLDDNPLWPNDR